MAIKIDRKLNWKSVSVALVSTHYGLGFLLGSGAEIYANGAIGIFYAVASAVGLFLLAPIASYYWKRKVPIWTLLGDVYGDGVKNLVAFLSGIWMLGVVASQILGGAYAATIFGIPKLTAAILISVAILLISFIRIHKLSKLLTTMLIFSSLVLFLILLKYGLSWVTYSTESFVLSLNSLVFDDIVGVFLTTILVTFLGMDFQQFLVSAKTKREAIKGSIAGGFILLALALILLSIIQASLNNDLMLGIEDSEQIVPLILYNFGFKISPVLGLLFSLPILFVSIGSGSAVSRIVGKTIMQFDLKARFFEKKNNCKSITVLLAFIVSLSGKSIISLIVSFYAVYVAAVFMPFLLHLASEKFFSKTLPTNAVRSTLIWSMVSSTVILVLSFFPGIDLHFSAPTNMLLVGFSASVIIFAPFFYKELKHKILS